MKEQEVVITNDASKINEYIKRGWEVKSVTAGHVATSSPFDHFGQFCFILERSR